MPRDEKNYLHRVSALGLSITQAADWLELPKAEVLQKALNKLKPPCWAIYCLEAMEAEFERDPEAFTAYALGDELEGDTWSAKTARATIPILVDRAQSGRGALTYADLDAELARRNPDRPASGRMTKYAFPLGKIGRTIDAIRREAVDATSEVNEFYAKLPPIECLVINARTGLPGEGIDHFLVSYLHALGQDNGEATLLDDRKQVVERIHRDIAGWSNWKLLLNMAER